MILLLSILSILSSNKGKLYIPLVFFRLNMEYQVHDSLEEMRKSPFFPLWMAASVSALVEKRPGEMYAVEIAAPKPMRPAPFGSIDQTVNFLGRQYCNYLASHANYKSRPSSDGKPAEDNGIVLNIFGQDQLHLYFDNDSKISRPFLDDELFEFEDRLAEYKLALPAKRPFDYSMDNQPPRIADNTLSAGYNLAEKTVRMINESKAEAAAYASEFNCTIGGLMSSIRPKQLGVLWYIVRNPGTYKLIINFLKEARERNTGAKD
jgi:hypothetical protein